MSLIKTWDFSLLNTAPSNSSTIALEQKSFILQWAAALVTFGWTADGSSNSTATHATSNVSVAADVVWGTGAHTWLLLKSPVGMIAGLDGSYAGDQSRIWIIIDLNSATTGIFTIKLYAGAKPTIGGSTSAAPTGSNALTFTNQQFSRTTASTNAIFHFAGTSDGYFWIGISYTGTGIMPFFFVAFPPTGIQQTSGLDYPFPVIFTCKYSDNANNPLLGTVFVSNTATFMWDYDGVNAGAGSNIMVMSNPAVIATVIGKGDAAGKDRRGNNLPTLMYMASTTTNKSQFIATVADFECTGAANAANGSTNAAGDKCLFGQIWFPANAAINA